MDEDASNDVAKMLMRLTALSVLSPERPTDEKSIKEMIGWNVGCVLQTMESAIQPHSAKYLPAVVDRWGMTKPLAPLWRDLESHLIKLCHPPRLDWGDWAAILQLIESRMMADTNQVSAWMRAEAIREERKVYYLHGIMSLPPTNLIKNNLAPEICNEFNIEFTFYTDTPPNKDMDAYIPTLRRYPKILWSKELPNGQML